MRPAPVVAGAGVDPVTEPVERPGEPPGDRRLVSRLGTSPVRPDGLVALAVGARLQRAWSPWHGARDKGDDLADIRVERRVVSGNAAAVLIGAVAADELLVVGTRGHGGFAGLLLGSVSDQCVRHAPRPVVVVHPPQAPPNSHDLAGRARTERRATA